MADAGRAWLVTLLAGRRRDAPGAEDSRLALEERILATQTEIVAMHRSLAMHKHALDAATRAPRKPGDTPPQATATGLKPGQTLDLPLDDEGLSCYAETQPMPFLDLRPPQPAGSTR